MCDTDNDSECRCKTINTSLYYYRHVEYRFLGTLSLDLLTVGSRTCTAVTHSLCISWAFLLLAGDGSFEVKIEKIED